MSLFDTDAPWIIRIGPSYLKDGLYTRAFRLAAVTSDVASAHHFSRGWARLWARRLSESGLDAHAEPLHQ